MAVFTDGLVVSRLPEQTGRELPRNNVVDDVARLWDLVAAFVRNYTGWQGEFEAGAVEVFWEGEHGNTKPVPLGAL